MFTKSCFLPMLPIAVLLCMILLSLNFGLSNHHHAPSSSRCASSSIRQSQKGASFVLLADALTEAEALKELYDTTGGPSWWSSCRLNGWPTFTANSVVCDKATSPFTTLSRITCNSMNGKVTAVSMSSCQMTGTLSGSILSALTKLESFDIGNNNFIGPLPVLPAPLSSLTNLDLVSNEFNGTFPGSAWVSQFPGLITLDVSGSSQITGSLPDAWANFATLRTLRVSGSKISGTLPAAWGTGLININDLRVSSTGISGMLPASWSGLTTLTTLNIEGNNLLTGTIPLSWSSMSSLQSLYLNSNSLNGSLTSWTSWNSITTIDLSSNAFTGSIPTTWTMFPSLTSVTLSSNPLGTTLPSLWGSMPAIRSITLSSCSLTGTLPASWGGMQTLNYLSITGNPNLIGTLPSEWSTLSSIGTIYLQFNGLNGTLPASWGSLSTLTTLYLYNNDFSGSLPASWSGMSRIRTLYLYSNALTGTLPPSWSRMQTLYNLYLDNNQLNGTLPPEWNQMNSLRNMLAYTNQLSGTLPPPWGNMTSLDTLYLYRNLLTGTLPLEWNGMTNMQNLYLYDNTLTGSLPPSWSNWTRLYYLYLQNNFLNGSLPMEWGSTMKQLRHVYLQNNAFSGSLPSSWGNMTALYSFDVQFNQLWGDLPDSWGSLTIMYSLNLNNNQFNGTLASSWSGMSNLYTFTGNSNSFCGPLPSSWGSLTNLYTFYFQNNTLNGTLPSTWSGMGNVRYFDLSMNDLQGTVPTSWQQGMRRIYFSSSPCRVRCFGFVGVNPNCLTIGSSTGCRYLRLWYNRLNRYLLPPVVIGNAWNWRDTSMNIGPQRIVTESRTLDPPTIPLTLSFSLSESVAVSGSVSDSNDARTASYSSLLSVSSSNDLTSSESLSRGEGSRSRTASPSWSPGTATPSSSRFRSTPSLTASLSSMIATWTVTSSPSPTHTPTDSVHTKSHSLIPTDSGAGRTATETIVELPEELPIPPVVVSASASSGGVGAVGSLAGVDPGGAAVQAVLTFLACQESEPHQDLSFELWLGMLPISPFVIMGLTWAVIGNVAVLVVFLVLHLAVVWSNKTIRGVSFDVSAASWRFPAVSIAVEEWLLSGVAVCGAALAAGVGGASVWPLALGWSGVALCVVALGVWYWATVRIAPRCHEVPFTPLDPIVPALLRVLGPRHVWDPKHEQFRLGVYFDSMREHCALWRWLCVMITCFVAALTGVGGVGPGSCTATFGLSSLILYAAAIALLVVRPHRIVTENILNPLKFVVLGLTCTTRVLLEGDREASALAALGYCQTLITLVRIAVKLYLTLEFRAESKSRKARRACEAKMNATTNEIDHSSSQLRLEEGLLVLGGPELGDEELNPFEESTHSLDDGATLPPSVAEPPPPPPPPPPPVALQPQVALERQESDEEDDEDDDPSRTSAHPTSNTNDPHALVIQDVDYGAMFIPSTAQPNDNYDNAIDVAEAASLQGDDVEEWGYSKRRELNGSRTSTTPTWAGFGSFDSSSSYYKNKKREDDAEGDDDDDAFGHHRRRRHEESREVTLSSAASSSSDRVLGAATDRHHPHHGGSGGLHTNADEAAVAAAPPPATQQSNGYEDDHIL